MQRLFDYCSALNVATGRLWNRFWFTPADASALGAIRVAVGLVSLYAIGAYRPDLQRLLSPNGMLPESLIRDFYASQWSLLNYIPAEQLGLFHIAAMILLALFTLGIGGRIVVVLAAIVVLSFFNRAPVLTAEFEPILSLLLVYLCVGRACDAYSAAEIWKQRRGETRPREPSPANMIALRLMQVHLALVHVMLGLAQLAADEQVWWSGEGIWLAAARPGMPLADFSWLADNHRLAAAWSHAVVIYFLVFPILAWFPLLRLLALVAGLAVWMSLTVVTGWVLFCVTMIIGTLSFLDSPWRRGLEQSIRQNLAAVS